MSKQNRSTDRAARAEAVRREAERKARTRQLGVAGAILVVLALVVGVGFLVQSQRDSTGDDVESPSAATETFGLVIGQDDAPAKVVIYEDFLCPVCAQFETQSRDRLEQFVADGAAQVEFRPFNLLQQYGDYSERATNAFAVVLDVSGPEVAKTFHHALFENQPAEAGTLPDDDWLIDLAVESGADRDAIEDPIRSLAFEGWVANATDQASKDFVQGTPTVRLDGEDVPGTSIPEMVDNLMAGIEAAS
ncbi:thioredoxin domain-containing protein [Nocardioides sp.]|uniref:DsbA family protein n=1 Tax=Nocardioides sp. TaxID=35761 RepID=UPI002736924C|nr:thioredoxin domain-containing protein [Nocardioides sp.]MDP3893959.1 thioredoxin domain-containing protein [Nocardioides sp.]